MYQEYTKMTLKETRVTFITSLNKPGFKRSNPPYENLLKKRLFCSLMLALRSNIPCHTGTWNK